MAIRPRFGIRGELEHRRFAAQRVLFPPFFFFLFGTHRLDAVLGTSIPLSIPEEKSRRE